MTLPHRFLPLAAAALVAAGLAAPAPASADTSEPDFYAVHDLDDDLWATRSLDCELAPADGVDLALVRDADAFRGDGVLRVTTSAGRLGGVVRVGTKGRIPVVDERVRAAGEAPTGIWRFESDGHVLTSDPVALEPGRWTAVELWGTTLHEGDRSETVEEFQTTFGKHPWTGGFLTGDCLGSPTAAVDTFETGRSLLDFEPSLWVDLVVKNGARTYDQAYGTQAALVGRLIDTELSGVEHPLAGKRLELWRQWTGEQRWTRVLRGTTNGAGEVRARPTVTESARYEWRRPAGEVRSRQVLVRPKVGFAARFVGPGVHLEDGTWLLPAGRPVTLVGRIRPALPVVVTYGDAERTVRPDRLGRFRIVLPPFGRDVYDVLIDADAPRGIQWAGKLLDVRVTRRP